MKRPIVLIAGAIMAAACIFIAALPWGEYRELKAAITLERAIASYHQSIADKAAYDAGLAQCIPPSTLIHEFAPGNAADAAIEAYDDYVRERAQGDEDRVRSNDIAEGRYCLGGVGMDVFCGHTGCFTEQYEPSWGVGLIWFFQDRDSAPLRNVLSTLGDLG